MNRMLKPLRIMILFFLLPPAIGDLTGAEELKPDALTATEILDRMAEVYANCKSYRDSGKVETTYYLQEGTHKEELSFQTAFIRPDRFRFEYKKTLGTKNRYIIWKKEDKVKKWWSIKPIVKKEESLELAIAGATGVSSSSAHTVPSLLLPDEIDGWKLNEIESPERIEDASLDSTRCFRIRGTSCMGPITIWIDQSTFLVLRIDEETPFEDFKAEETTTYKPEVNIDIPDQELEFNLHGK